MTLPRLTLDEAVDEIVVRTADQGLANIGPGTQVIDEPGPNSRRKDPIWKLHRLPRKRKGLPRKPVGEAEPGGDEPADSAGAKTLARQMLKSPETALSFRQLWRHKYIEHNLDASKAWKLFYWPMTHSGAGGKGYNPNTRVAASKLMVSAFSKWAKAGMKAKVRRADGMKELPVGQISRAEFVKWYSGGGKTGTTEALYEAAGLGLKDMLEDFYEAEYKYHELKNNPHKWSGLPKRYDNVLDRYADDLRSLASSIARRLRPYFKKWLAEHALTNPKKWGVGRVKGYEEAGEHLGDGMIATTEEYKRYAKSEIKLYRAGVDLSKASALKKLIGVLLNEDKAGWDEDEDGPFPYADEQDYWDENIAANYSDGESFGDFLEALNYPKAELWKIIGEIAAQVVFPAWFKHWKAKGIVKTRKRVVNAHRALGKAAKGARRMEPSDLVVTINTALNIAHQTGSFLEDYIEPYEEGVNKQFLAHLSRLATTKWRKELNKLGLSEALDEIMKRKHPLLLTLLDIEGGTGIYSYIGVPDYVKKDAGKLYDAIRKKNKKVAQAILKKHFKQETKGDVQGGPKQVKPGSAPRSAISRAARAFLSGRLDDDITTVSVEKDKPSVEDTYVILHHKLDELIARLKKDGKKALAVKARKSRTFLNKAQAAAEKGNKKAALEYMRTYMNQTFDVAAAALDESAHPYYARVLDEGIAPNPASFADVNNYANRLAKQIAANPKAAMMSLFKARKPSRQFPGYYPRQVRAHKENRTVTGTEFIEALPDKAVQPQPILDQDGVRIGLNLGNGFTITKMSPAKRWVEVGSSTAETAHKSNRLANSLRFKWNGSAFERAGQLLRHGAIREWYALSDERGRVLHYAEGLQALREHAEDDRALEWVRDADHDNGTVRGYYEDAAGDRYTIDTMDWRAFQHSHVPIEDVRQFTDMPDNGSANDEMIRILRAHTGFTRYPEMFKESLDEVRKLPVDMLDADEALMVAYSVAKETGKTVYIFKKKYLRVAYKLPKGAKKFWKVDRRGAEGHVAGKKVKTVTFKDGKPVFESLDEAIGPLNMAGQRKVTFKTDRGMKLKGTTVTIPGFKEFKFVLVPAHGSKVKATKVGWSVYEYRTGLPIWMNTLVPNQPDLDKPEDAVNQATKRLKNLGAEKLSAGLAKLKKVNESLEEIFLSHGSPPRIVAPGKAAIARPRVTPLIFPGDELTTIPRKRRKPKAADPLGPFLEDLFVEQPPNNNGNGNGNDKPKPTTRDAKTAEKEDFDIDDIQLFYDMQIAGSASREEAETATRRQFKIKTLTVNPAGRIAVKGLDKPTPPKAMVPAPPAGDVPPEPPPEEPEEPEAPPTPPGAGPGLPRKKPTKPEALNSSQGDERPSTRTVGGMVGGGTIPRTGGSLWPIRTSLRRRIHPLAVERSTVKRPLPGEPLYKAFAG